jgi:cell division protein FtsB
VVRRAHYRTRLADTDLFDREDDSRKFADVEGEIERLRERNAVLEKRVEALETEREQSRTEEAK